MVLAARGYPGTVQKGALIEGLEEAARVEGVEVLHAGTRRSEQGVVTAGGRVLAVTASGDDLDVVAERAYEAISKIHFEGMQYRRDIAARSRRKP